jgi:hypothetical protein
MATETACARRDCAAIGVATHTLSIQDVLYSVRSGNFLEFRDSSQSLELSLSVEDVYWSCQTQFQFETHPVELFPFWNCGGFRLPLSRFVSAP